MPNNIFSRGCRSARWVVSILLGLLPLAPLQAEPLPDLVLQASLNYADHQTYRRVGFDVPPGVARITIEASYTGSEERTVVDFGLIDSEDQLVGWSGGNKRLFTVSAVDASPSYSPRPIRSGRWNVLLGIPNIRPASISELTLKVFFSRSLDISQEPAALRAPLKAGAGWYRGDLHTHTGHSDGSCPSLSLRKLVPCPVFKTADMAAQRKLDFVVITDHNASSHANAIRELQPYYDHLLLIPGRELTSFVGHATIIGTVKELDFKPHSPEQGWDAALAALDASSFVSINHPVRPSGEFCMGCGWRGPLPNPHLQGIEVVNGDDLGTPYSGLPFWQQALDEGHRLTAVAGSDNHQPDQDAANWGALGRPATVVFASELSQIAVIDALRKGHAFIDMSKALVTSAAPKIIELWAEVNGAQGMMGDLLTAKAGQPILLKVKVQNAQGLHLHLHASPSLKLPAEIGAVTGAEAAYELKAAAPTGKSWVFVEVRDAFGKLVMMSNPLYFQP